MSFDLTIPNSFPAGTMTLQAMAQRATPDPESLFLHLKLTPVASGGQPYQAMFDRMGMTHLEAALREAVSGGEAATIEDYGMTSDFPPGMLRLSILTAMQSSNLETFFMVISFVPQMPGSASYRTVFSRASTEQLQQALAAELALT